MNSKPFELIYFADLIFMGMWFLTVLFVLSVVGAVIYKVAPDYHILFWSVTYIAVYFVPCGIFLGNELKFLMPFFVLGIFSSHIQWERMSPWLGAISLVIFAWCSIYYRFDDSYYISFNEQIILFSQKWIFPSSTFYLF